MPRREAPSTLPQIRPNEARATETPASPAAGPPAPKRLGRYEILFELARGGMGTVYVGRLVGAHGVDRLVAIKRLSAPAATDEARAAFLREARLTARISHPNVVSTFELGEHEGAPFLVMQLVEGVSLARLNDRMGSTGASLDPDLAAWIIAQAATGLHAAHELTTDDGEPLGLVHRDVSPHNLLLSFDGRVYVADFGVAKLRLGERVTESGVLKGKFAYMSPEQTRALSLDRRSDVFSLGIVLHETLTGRPLFDTGAPAETIRAICEVDPPSPRDARPDVSEELVPIVMRSLAKRAADRFSSAGELADALRSSLRARRALVDERELASLIGELFGSERDAFRGRVRAAVLGKDVSSVRVDPSQSQGSVTAAVRAALPRRGRLAGATAALVLGAGIAVGIVAVRTRTGASGAARDGSAGAIASEVATRAPAPPALEEPEAPEASAAAPTRASLVAGATRSAGPSTSAAAAAAKPRPRAAATSAAATGPSIAQPTSSSTAAPSASAPTSVRGVPFRDLAP